MTEVKTHQSDSELDHVIAPEIKGDRLYDLIMTIAANQPLTNVLEIGSSAGGGSTEAFVRGLAVNPGKPRLFCLEVSRPRFDVLREAYRRFGFVNCYNMSSVEIGEFPTAEEVAEFYRSVRSNLQRYELAEVLRWLRQDIDYIRDSGVDAGAIGRIKRDHGITTFDLVLIDGSEFTGEIEFEKVYGAKIILLDDVNTYKNFKVRQRLLADPDYRLAIEDLELRNGFSIFRRKDVELTSLRRQLPIHFFTIVLNGEPFIRYHEHVLSRLPVPWHWHIVEGVASLVHDTSWSVASGGHIPASIHDRGRSNDGTAEYLDGLAARVPDRVTLYRKPLDEFWDGKREMCNAPLSNIMEECLLWQIDADELWTAEQISAVHREFVKDPSRTAALFWCDYFVGPEKMISTRYNYAENPAQEWRRTWRFKPGDRWLTHEPPTLSRRCNWVSRQWRKLERRSPFRRRKEKAFRHDETEAVGAVFQHFAYATEAQVNFKESYYGYTGALEKWRVLQSHRGSGFLRDYFPWVTDECLVDDAATLGVAPVAWVEDGRWTFATDGGTQSQRRDCALPRPRIVVDGYFFQIARSGIARVWLNLFRVWSKSGFAEYIIVLDRAGTAPRIEGLHYVPIGAFDYGRVGADSIRLEEICRRFDADLFVSTYYTTPLTTPSVFMGYDMIPEVFDLDPEAPSWREKRRGIEHASAHIMISNNSARDLERFMPCVAPNSTIVAHCGVDPAFKPLPEREIGDFRQRHALTKPYLLLVGERTGTGDYKNGELAFKAFAELPDPERYTLLCVGGKDRLEANLTKLKGGRDVRKLKLSDEELVAAYAGAHVLIVPSRYEGFGLPIVEAMACGCPVIACRNSSIPEVAGDAALFVSEDDPKELAARVTDLESAELRQSLQKRGFAQAARFDFTSMAATIEAALRDVHRKLLDGRLARPGAGWRELRELERKNESGH
jgi:glycosyltransferase involved in cell wall biosynthesis